MINTYKYTDNTQLSEHFSVSEFRCKCGNAHNTLISSELIAKLESLYTALNAGKCVVTSGYRCSSHDQNVGGNGSGQHTKGTAADVIFYDISGNPVGSALVCCKAQDIGFTGIGRIDGTAVHVDVRTFGRWFGDETAPGGTASSVTSDFYQYFGISKHSWTNACSENIKNLQKILNAKGENLTIDGIAGEKTLAACKKYTICNGDKGALTKWVQEKLNSIGFNCGTADGIAGAKTMSGIADFQKSNALGTGYLGGEDWYFLIR